MVVQTTVASKGRRAPSATVSEVLMIVKKRRWFSVRPQRVAV